MQTCKHATGWVQAYCSAPGECQTAIHKAVIFAYRPAGACSINPLFFDIQWVQPTNRLAACVDHWDSVWGNYRIPWRDRFNILCFTAPSHFYLARPELRRIQISRDGLYFIWSAHRTFLGCRNFFAFHCRQNSPDHCKLMSHCFHWSSFLKGFIC